MNTTLDQIIEINNGEPVIKENVPVEYYQKGIYQWWHDDYGCIYVVSARLILRIKMMGCH